MCQYTIFTLSVKHSVWCGYHSSTIHQSIKQRFWVKHCTKIQFLPSMCTQSSTGKQHVTCLYTIKLQQRVISTAMDIRTKHKNCTGVGGMISSVGGSAMPFRGANIWPGIGGLNLAPCIWLETLHHTDNCHSAGWQSLGYNVQITASHPAGFPDSLFWSSLYFVFLLYSQMGTYFYFHS